MKPTMVLVLAGCVILGCGKAPHSKKEALAGIRTLLKRAAIYREQGDTEGLFSTLRPDARTEVRKFMSRPGFAERMEKEKAEDLAELDKMLTLVPKLNDSHTEATFEWELGSNSVRRVQFVFIEDQWYFDK